MTITILAKQHVMVEAWHSACLYAMVCGMYHSVCQWARQWSSLCISSVADEQLI